MTGRPTGLQVGSTKPLSRAERRAQAARVQAADDAPAVVAAEEENPGSSLDAPPLAPHKPIVKSQLPPRRRAPKRPFSTQLRPATVDRLEWVKSQGQSITDVVDAAVNAFLDNAGVPHSVALTPPPNQ